MKAKVDQKKTEEKKKDRKDMLKKGAIRELNPGPLVPETRIIPLDQSPNLLFSFH